MSGAAIVNKSHTHTHTRAPPQLVAVDMALRNAIGSCARLQLCRTGPRVRRAHGRLSCGGGDKVEPCPPPARTPPPPCRARPAHRRTATRLVCCPPPAGNPPPCAPPTAADPLTCADARPKGGSTARAATCDRKRECGVELDRVARRLAEAERRRRLEYEREAAARRAAPCDPAPAPAPYAPGVMRQCRRATDGRDYVLPGRAPPPPPCGPDRTPPPPQDVPLAHDDAAACTSHGAGALDPCAHRPPTILHVDRGARRPDADGGAPPPAAGEATPSGSRADAAPPARPKRFTRRLIESLSLSRAAAAPTCPRRECGAPRGESERCPGPPPRAPAPRCRDPTPAELIARRPPPRCAPRDSRRLHTTARGAANADNPRSEKTELDSRPDPGKLERVLRDRESYGEAGRGRVVVDEGSPGGRAPEPAARLDVCVPPGADRLSVRVSLAGGCDRGGRASRCARPRRGEEARSPGGRPPQPVSAPEAGARRCRGAGSELPEKRESWLSIRSLLSNCRKGDDAKFPKGDRSPPRPPRTPKKQSVPGRGSACGPPAPPSQKRAPPPPPPVPCYPPFPSAVPDKPPADRPPSGVPASSPCRPRTTTPPPRKTDCPPSEPKDPCSSNKTKFLADKELQLRAFLFKW